MDSCGALQVLQVQPGTTLRTWFSDCLMLIQKLFCLSPDQLRTQDPGNVWIFEAGFRSHRAGLLFVGAACAGSFWGGESLFVVVPGLKL